MHRTPGPFDSDDALFAPIGEHPADSAPMPSIAGASSPLDGSYADRRVPNSEIDRYFDGEIGCDESEALFEKLASRPDKAEEIVWTQRAIDALREPMPAPNLAPGILQAVDRRRSWLSPAALLRVQAVRYAAAVVLLGVVGAGYAFQRLAPEATSIAAPPEAHLSSIVQASVETASAMEQLPCGIEHMCSELGLDARSDVEELQYTIACPLPGHPQPDAPACCPMERRERAAIAVEYVATAGEPLFLPETLDTRWASDEVPARRERGVMPAVMSVGTWADLSTTAQPRMLFVGGALAPETIAGEQQRLPVNPFRDRR